METVPTPKAGAPSPRFYGEQQTQQESPAIADGASEFGRRSTAYLRVAHIYMLISIPTDTSTIFGAFQAILALPLIPDELALVAPVIDHDGNF